MATISGSRAESVYTMGTFYGLNENPDGDTKLKLGEASVCQNWKITRDKNLRRRNGYAVMQDIGTGRVNGLWSGELNGKLELLGACDGHLWKLWDADNGTYIKVDLGTLVTDDRVTFMPFGGIVYIMNGHEYYQYDGTTFKMVVGYRPLIATSLTPAGALPTGGSQLEQTNKLCGLRRLQFSPDGTSTDFCMAFEPIISVDYVMRTSDGSYVDPEDYTIDIANSKVIFDTAPTAGTNTIEIGYTAVNTYRRNVTQMRFGELYSGSTDVIMFLYGDGTNQAIYSGITNDGIPRGDYFPDLNVMAVGDANTPITSMIRHLSALIIFKPTSTYSASYGTVTLATGDMTEGFYCLPINKTLGNEPMGMVQNVLNYPYTICGNDIYLWKSNSYYSSSLSRDERTAKRISDRVFSTLHDFDLQNCYTFDDNFAQEYYVIDVATARALVYNYVADAWYFYNHFPVCSAVSFKGEMLFGSTVGKLEKVSEDYYSDNGEAFKSRWESGSIDFGRPYERKYSSEMWVVIKPESRGHVGVTIRTDKKSDYTVQDSNSYLLDFWNINFDYFTFEVNRSPQTHRHRLKAKKFCFYKIIFESNDAHTGATILTCSSRIRFIGYAK